jgi:hypothetical protein
MIESHSARIDGTLVKEIVSNSNVARWNMNGSGNTPVATGIYTYRIKLGRADKPAEASGIFQVVP